MSSRFRWRTQYDDTQDLITRELTNIECLDEHLAIQNAPGADINETLAQFGITDGSILPGQLGIDDPRYYGDHSDMPDLRTALDRLQIAQEMFNALPADIRSRFRNDPIQLHEWVSQPANAEEAVKIGLLSRIPLPQQATAAPPQAPANPPGGSAGT